MSLIIHFLTNDGSPLGPTSKTIWGDHQRIGLGGAEIAMITLCEEWTKAGHEVVLYNNPWETNASPFEQRSIDSFRPEDDRDILIIFRSPNHRVGNAVGKKCWFSCDQLTMGNYVQLANSVDKIVCISPFHQKYFADTYRITNTVCIDLPIRVSDYDAVQREPKVPYRLIFNSVPARGLDNAQRQYEIIKRECPQASIVITSDYRLWGAGTGNEQFRLRWRNLEDVIFLGAVPRARLIQEQFKAQINLYPCNYDELFCVVVGENQYAGAYPVTSSKGALATTNMGTVIDADADDAKNDRLFVDAVLDLFADDNKLARMQNEVSQMAWTRFRPETILEQWDRLVFN